MPNTPTTPLSEPIVPPPLDQPGNVYSSHPSLQHITTEGEELDKEDMSVCDKILYPTPCERLCCDHFFTTLCALSTLGCVLGSGATCCPTTIQTPLLMQQLFAWPALLAWGGCSAGSMAGMVHYRFGHTKKYQPNQNNDSPDPSLGQPVISVSTPIGYQPPTPSAMI